jgi:benzoyl-CoA reductase/2-hydroxyglutaryl-CoA dehydratase subunit BcrC/BadD/HgdB
MQGSISGTPMKTVVYNSPFVPPEWIAAHGLRPLRMRPRAASAAAAPALAGMCPLARAMLGEVISGGGDAAVFATTCDQMRRIAGLAAAGAAPVFLMNVPATWQTPAAARLYRDELRRLGRWLVEQGGAAPSREDLVCTLADWDGRRRRLRAALGTAAPAVAARLLDAYHRGEDVPDAGPATYSGWRVSRPATFVGATLVATGQEALRAEHDSPPRVPLALVGGPLMAGEGVFETIDAAGGTVVLDATETGTRTLPPPLDARLLRDDPLMELVDAYFGGIPDAFRRPDDALHAYLARELAASGARGIVIWRYVWCDHWAAAVARLRDETNLPVLDLDLAGDDADASRLAGRLQAFMELFA